jgi:hypothetical protein
MKIDSNFDVKDKVIIDGCKDLVVVVTAVVWRNVHVVNYEVSWMSNGKSESAVIEGWRINHCNNS